MIRFWLDSGNFVFMKSDHKNVCIVYPRKTEKFIAINIIIIIMHLVRLNCEVERKKTVAWFRPLSSFYICSSFFFHIHILRDSLPTLKLLPFLESFNCYWVYCQSKIPLSMTWLQYLARQFFYFYFCLLLVFRCHLIFFSLSTLIIPSIVNCCHGFHNKSRRKSRTTLLTKLNFQQFSMLANIFRHRCYCLQCVKYFQLDVACTVMKYKSDNDR